jgi:ribonuclease E
VSENDDTTSETSTDTSADTSEIGGEHTAPEQGFAPADLDEADLAPEQGQAPEAETDGTPAQTPAPGAVTGDPTSEATKASGATEAHGPLASLEPVKPARRRARRPVVAAFSAPETPDAPVLAPIEPSTDAEEASVPAGADEPDAAPRRRRARRPAAMPTFQAVDPETVAAAADAGVHAAEDAGNHEFEQARPTRTRNRRPAAAASEATGPTDEGDRAAEITDADDETREANRDEDRDDDGEQGSGPRRRRRGRRGRGRGRGEGDGLDSDGTDSPHEEDGPVEQDGSDEGSGTGPDDESGEAGTRRRRRRRRSGTGGEEGDGSPDDPPNTVVKVREPRAKKSADPDGVRGVSGSTRLEAKRQRRRDGRTGPRRAPIVTESEYLARREAVERTMIVRNQGERTQIAVLEDGVLVEHYVTRASASSYAGNVYLGKVQNVLPSMEAAFVDIGKGRNAVLYAGEVNYDAAGTDGGRAHTIQEALKSGQNVLVQVTKDPIGQKGSRLTSQVTLPGRYLVYVPEGSMTGISRKLPDVERARLKAILKKIVPEDAGVIIRTAAEGASEEELARDVERLQQQWVEIQAAAKKADKHAPALVHAEPDLVVRVVRDVFNEDFTSLIVQGVDEWSTIEAYVASVAPDLLARASRWTSEKDVFTAHRVEEQLVRALDRKVHLPSGGSLVIDRTEAMTVVDVNTGKFTGKGGNLEETVTKNNLEAAEEIVRQLRLRDVGGMIVIDFIDMVLESNRDLVLRRMTECLGRDRTRHQVAEVTSLGLVQMTRKRVGTGLLEAYSEPCLACQGRGVLIHMDGPPARAEHVHEPAIRRASSPKPKAPVPRPPSSRAEDDADDADDSLEPVAVVAASDEGPADATAGTEPGVDGVSTAVDAPAPVVASDAAAPGAAEATEVAEVAAPKRRRRRATSGGPVSAVPEDAAVS